MPVTFDQTVQYARTQGDNASVYLHDQQSQVDSHSGVSFILRLFGCEKSVNRASINTFIQSIRTAYPQAGQDALNTVDGLLSDLLAKGSPLQAGTVTFIKTVMDVDHAQTFAHNLERGGQLPPGHAAAFAQFVGVMGLPTATPADQMSALKRYTLEQVIPDNTGALGRITNAGARNELYTTILSKLCEPLTGDHGFYAAQLDRMLQQGIDHFSFDDFRHVMATSNTPVTEVLDRLSEGAVQELAHRPQAGLSGIVDTLVQASPVLDGQKCDALAAFIFNGEVPVPTPQEQRAAIRDFMLDKTADDLAQDLSAYQLPDSIGRAVCLNPEVVRNATATLDAQGGIPTQEQVTAALVAARNNFCEAHGGVLRELVQMAQNPPLVLKPALSAQTLPLYLNAMLAGDAVLEPLLNDTVPLDASFMGKLMDYSRALNSGTKFIRGDYGADDASSLIKNTMQLLMARRGIDAPRFPELLGRTVQKFGALSSELSTLALSAQARGGAGGPGLVRDAMTLVRILEGQGRELLDLIPRADRNAFGASIAKDPVTQEDITKDREKGSRFIENTFEKERPLETLSDAVRTFAADHGVRLPDANAAAQRTEAGNRLDDAAHGVTESVKNSLFVDNNMIRDPLTPTFRAMVADAGRETDLTGIDLDAVNMTTIGLPIMKSIDDASSAAQAAGRVPTVDELREAAYPTVLQEMRLLKGTLDAIAALPEIPAGAAPSSTTFSPAEKALMATMAQRYGIRDAAVLGRFCVAARQSKSSLENIALPCPTANQILENFSKLSEIFIHTQHAIGEPAPRGTENAATCVMDMALTLLHPTPLQVQSLDAMIHSPLAEKTASVCNYMATLDEGRHPALGERFLSIPVLMNGVRIASELVSRGDAHIDPLHFSFCSTVNHISEIPGDAMPTVRSIEKEALNTRDDVYIGDLDVQLGRHVPQPDETTRVRLHNIYHQILGGTHGRNAFLLPYLISAASGDLLAAQPDPAKPLTTAQLWETLLGGHMPRGTTEANFGDMLINTARARYVEKTHLAAPDVQTPIAEANFDMGFMQCVTPKKLIALTGPGARLTKDDIHISLEMSSLRMYDPSTAYGLVTDFRRADPRGIMLMEAQDGHGMQISPFHIPDAENVPGHPAFTKIIDFAASITQSEAQKSRVLQAFSQASLVMSRAASSLFPGVAYSEHGRFTVNARQQANNDVIVDISTDPTLPLLFHEQFVIHTDGSHECTVFDMSRPAVGGAGD